MYGRIRTLLGRAARSYVLFVAVGLVIGLTLAPVAWQSTQSEGTVAVVQIAGTIDGGTANSVGAALEHAREDGEVDAVVLVANSGGGSAPASEELYIHTKRTAKEMPVVASVGASAASGAYYAIAPSDRIYATPSSLVGSVGVIASPPGDVEPNDVVATTGPNKASGASGREFYAILETLGEAFYNAVIEGRGDALELSRSELAQGRIYPGTEAVQNGLVDEIGSREMAIDAAAERAGLDTFEVEVVSPDGPSLFVSRANYLSADVPEKRMVDSSYLTGNAGSAPVILMVPASFVVEGDGTGSDRPFGTESTSRARVVARGEVAP